MKSYWLESKFQVSEKNSVTVKKSAIMNCRITRGLHTKMFQEDVSCKFRSSKYNKKQIHNLNITTKSSKCILPTAYSQAYLVLVYKSQHSRGRCRRVIASQRHSGLSHTKFWVSQAT